ncbi:MAG: HU family DNA-binding protein [Bacteroidales bacterium]|nr:HU family DNA-binding protein [Bacteroidales bacterium]
MPISYIKKYQKVPQGGKMVERYLAKVSYNTYVTENTLAEEISKMSTASVADVKLVLAALEDRISFHIAGGDVVKLQTLGAFYPTIRAQAVDNPDMVNHQTIKAKGVRFEPSAAFRERIKQTGVRLASNNVFDAVSHPNTKVEKK